jgi:hypothetical protein
MIDIKLTTKKVEVFKSNNVIKQEEINQEQFKSLMHELAGERIDMLRKVSKLLKAKSFTFKDIKHVS